MLLQRVSKQLSAGSAPLTSPLLQRGHAALTPRALGRESRGAGGTSAECALGGPHELLRAPASEEFTSAGEAVVDVRPLARPAGTALRH